MALTKVGNGGIENVTNSANATFLTIDASEQITVASEGGAVTTSVQQGLAKCWIKFDPNDSNAIRDSLNFASITDEGVGEHMLVFSSSMANADYCIHVTGSTNRSGAVDTDQMTTSQYSTETDADDSGNRADTNHTFSSAHGDLA